MADVTIEPVSVGRVERENKGVRFSENTHEGYERLREEPPPRPELAAGGGYPPTLEECQRESLLALGANLAKAVLGVGILALPRVFSLLGIGTATLFLGLVALLTYLSLHALMRGATHTGLLSYSDVIREVTGVAGQAVLDLALIVNCFGIMCVALIVVGDLLVGGGQSEGLLSEANGDRRTVLAVVTLLLLAPLVSTNRMRALAGASMLGVAGILLWAVITLLLFIVAWTNGKLHSMHWWLHGGVFTGHGFQSAVQVVAMLPIITVAFMNQHGMQHSVRDLVFVRERHVRGVGASALGVCTTVFLVISICSYGLFGQAAMEADVLRNFTVAALEPLVWTRLAQAVFMTVRLAVFLSLVVTIPLLMAPFRDALWKLLFRQTLQGPGFYLVTYLTLFCAWLVAVNVRSIWEPLVIIGSTAGVLIAFVFPGLLALCMEEELTESRGARVNRALLGLLMLLLGVVIGVAGVIRVIAYDEPRS